MSYRVLHEGDDHFVVNDGASSFRVAKAGLGRDTIAKIQRFAEGGEVAEPEPEPAPAPVVPDAQQLPPPVDPESDAARAAAGRAANAAWLRDVVGGFGGLGERAIPEEARAFASEGALPEDAKPAKTEAPPESLHMAEFPAVPAKPAPAAPQATAGAQAGGGSPGTVAAPRADALDAAMRQGERGIVERAAVAGQEAAAVAEVAKQRETAMSEVAKGFQDRMGAHEKRVDALRQDILTTKIDPARFWNTRTESQKTSAAIAMILGGIGSGMTHGPNMALEIISKSIDRDIDAQRANLGKKQSLLASYLEQGRDMREAHNLAKADLVDISAAQLQRAAAQYGGPKAQAEADIAAAEAKKQAFQLRQEAEMRHAQIQMARVELGLKAQQMQYMRYQMQLAQAAASGQRIENVEGTPDGMRERFGTLPDGRKVLAKTPKGAEAIDSASMAARELKEITAEMRKFREEEGRNFLPGTAAARKAEALHLRALKAFAGTAGVANYANLPSAELEQFKGVVPNPGKIAIGDAGFMASLEQMEREANQRLLATLGTNASGYVPQQVGRKQ